MSGKIVSLASAYIVGQWNATMGNYVYEATRCYLDNRLLDENSPEYHRKNITSKTPKKVGENDD